MSKKEDVKTLNDKEFLDFIKKDAENSNKKFWDNSEQVLDIHSPEFLRET